MPTRRASLRSYGENLGTNGLVLSPGEKTPGGLNTVSFGAPDNTTPYVARRYKG